MVEWLARLVRGGMHPKPPRSRSPRMAFGRVRALSIGAVELLGRAVRRQRLGRTSADVTVCPSETRRCYLPPPPPRPGRGNAVGGNMLFRRM